MKRAAILTSIVVGGLAVAGIAAAQRAAEPAPSNKIEHIKGNLYKIFDGCSCGNTTVFVTDKGVVLVDTKVARNGQFILDQVKTVTDKPVIMMINTHIHPDHNGSNEEIKAVYPNIDVVAHENLKKRVEDSMKLPPPPPGTRGPARYTAAQDPNISFSDKRSVLSGKDRIDLYYFGRGHTDNDIFVVYPSVGVMNVGDLMAWDMAPLIDPGTNGSVLALPDTMEKADKGIPKGIDQIITGHGAVFPRKTMTDYASYMRDLVNESKKGLAANQTPDEVLAALQKVEEAKDPARSRYFTHDNKPGLEYGQSPATRSLININVAYEELSGETVSSFFGGALKATDKHKGGSNPDLLSPPRPPRPGPPGGGAGGPPGGGRPGGGPPAGGAGGPPAGGPPAGAPRPGGA
jgi:glyoxylase-like metal-dependent hydrolase (beta-lactamase superfamily II)